MTDLPFSIVNVFTREPFGGNPLAVFRHAEGLTRQQMQQIARQMNLSETTFVTPSARPDCDVRVRIFTPFEEIPMAGHPTVGTAHVLDRGPHIVFEEGVGPVPVSRSSREDVTWWQMTQPAPSFGPPLTDLQAVATSLCLSVDELSADLPVQTVVTGVPFVMVPLRSLEALSRIRLDLSAWDRIRGNAAGLYPFVRLGNDGVRCRMIGYPGIAEDPATGSAAGPLVAYLYRYGAHDTERLLVQQGVEMGRPSTMEVCVDGPRDAPHGPQVAGPSFVLGHGTLSF